VLHYQEAVVVLLLDGHELKDCEGAAHLQFCEVAIQSAEDAGVVATDGGEIKASCPKLILGSLWLSAKMDFEAIYY
jgi:hypothetical protein